MENMQTKIYQEHISRANDTNLQQQYWKEYAQQVSWDQFPNQILTKESEYIYKWFKDGKINMAYNCIDRHAETSPHQAAIIWESSMAKQTKIYTYLELKDQVSKLATVMIQLGLKTGDTCIIYMPMIPEAVFAMLACARLGVTHSVVFGGFASQELASRITDCSPKLIFSASCGIEPHKLVDYKEILDNAIFISQKKNIKTIILQRQEKEANLIPGQDHDYHLLIRQVENGSDCVPVHSDHPLYILYTSGTTGSPKGITRDTGGTVVALNWTMKHIKDINKGDVYFSSSDIGWVVGHSFIVYGPLIRGATTIIYEGKPNTPNAGIFWSLIEKHKVKGFYTAPTAVRFLKKEDPNHEWVKKYDVSSLKIISLAGERCDIPSYNWLQTSFPGVLINDNYWQTETGWMISCNYQNLTKFISKPGSATYPAPGFIVKIFNDENIEQKQGDIGRICCKLPMPPSFMLGLWNNQQGFIDKYLKDTDGYYTTGDAGYFDEDGYLNVMTRLDDVINTAGHRLSTAQMEEVLLNHQSIAEAAVVGGIDELKGEIPVGFIVLKNGVTTDKKIIEKDLVNLIREKIGPVACYSISIFVDRLPKTRSGKVLRSTIRSILNHKKYNFPATIDDETTLEIIQKAVDAKGLKDQKILYKEH